MARRRGIPKNVLTSFFNTLVIEAGMYYNIDVKYGGAWDRRQYRPERTDIKCST